MSNGLPRPPYSFVYAINYPLELANGGQGVQVATSTAASSAVAIPAVNGDTITVFNDGGVTLYFLLGGPNVRATTSCTPIGAGNKEVFTIPNDGGDYRYVSTITRVGTTSAVVNVSPRGS